MKKKKKENLKQKAGSKVNLHRLSAFFKANIRFKSQLLRCLIQAIISCRVLANFQQKVV